MVVKDPVFPASDTPKSKYEKLENRISKFDLCPDVSWTLVLMPACR